MHDLLPIDFLKLSSRVVFFHAILLIPISRFVLCLPFKGQISTFSINSLELLYLLAIKQKLVSFLAYIAFLFHEDLISKVLSNIYLIPLRSADNIINYCLGFFELS